MAKFACLIMLCLALNARAQQLHFNDSGAFKILQITDTHIDYKHGINDPVFDLVAELSDAEKPDLVMFTGDVVVKKDPAEVYGRFEKIFADRHIYWAVVLGNHDEEFGTSRRELVEILKKFPHCLTNQVKDIKGASNFVLPVRGKGNETAALIYGIDSNSKSKMPDRVKNYDWIGLDQINWYQKVSRDFTRKHAGDPLPALLFLHIPFTEFNDAWDNTTSRHFGVKNERVSCPDVNSGMFTALLESRDVMGVFAGHDHVDDFIGLSHQMALAFGRCSGGENAYGNLPDGGRVIVLKEGKRVFDTWIHEKGGKIVDPCTYPTSFNL